MRRHEALVAAISEKESYISLLEIQQNHDALPNARRQRDKLMRRLKEENERRVRLLADLKHDATDLTAPLSLKAAAGGAGDVDDEDGIWA